MSQSTEKTATNRYYIDLYLYYGMFPKNVSSSSYNKLYIWNIDTF